MQSKQTKRIRIRWDRIFLVISIIVNITLLFILYTKYSNTIPINYNILKSHTFLDENMLFYNSNLQQEKTSEEVKEVVQETVDTKPVINKVDYRLTSYWRGDTPATGSCTGSGLCEKDFQINNKGWYTYKGYLVLAAATTYMQKDYGIIDGKQYYKYYDIVNLTIDGIDYQGIIIDSCGACSYVSEQRLDLFVSGASSQIDRGYKGHNTIQVWKEG